MYLSILNILDLGNKSDNLILNYQPVAFYEIAYFYQFLG